MNCRINRFKLDIEQNLPISFRELQWCRNVKGRSNWFILLILFIYKLVFRVIVVFHRKYLLDFGTPSKSIQKFQSTQRIKS